MIVLTILVAAITVMEVVRLVLTIKSNRTIDRNYRMALQIGVRWNELCQGIRAMCEAEKEDNE